MIREGRLAASIRTLAAAIVCLLALATAPARAEPFGWPQAGGPGSPVVVTFSFANLLDPAFEGIPESQLRAATYQAFGLWTLYAPLHFIERPDSGPQPSEQEYAREGHPDIRIGAHEADDALVLAHAFFPIATHVSGLAGDIHFNSASVLSWGIDFEFPVIDFLEVMLHEIGHALGVEHITDADAVMNPLHGFRFGRSGAPFLLPPDIAAVQAIYGTGIGSVQPIPEPSTLALVGAGVIAVLRRTRRSRVQRP